MALVYILLPQRHAISEANGTTFKQNHFYSLLLLSKLFRASSDNPVHFYYINEAGFPKENHYHRWLHDEFWQDKIGKDNIKFIKIDQERLNGTKG